jgi:hypothetical protein
MVAAMLFAGLAALVAGAPAEEGASVSARSVLVTGEVVRADLARQVLVVKIAGKEPRETEIATDDATRFTAGGRSVRLEDVRPGERITASCTPAGQDRCLARLVRAGGGRSAVPAPSATPARP